MKLLSKRLRPLLELLEDRCQPSFSPVTFYPVGTAGFHLAAGDFNNDGRVDLVVANEGSGTVSVLLSNSDGSFQAALDSPAGASPNAIAVGDFNADGKLDVVTTQSGVPEINVLLGKGDGTFELPQNIVLPGQFPANYTGATPLDQYPTSVAVGDINHDGKIDVVVGAETSFTVLTGTGYYGNYYTTYEDGYVNVLLGNGDGTFADPTAIHEGANTVPEGIALADVNGDGNLDVVSENAVSYDIAVLRGNGDGTFQAAQHSGYGGWYSNVPLGDFDGDGKLDVLMQGEMLKGNGDGTFQSGTPLTYGANAVVGDINGDGKLDIAFVQSSAHYTYYTYYGAYDPVTDDYATVLLGYGDGTFAPPTTSFLGEQVGYGYGLSDAVLGDFNNDGRPDLAGANPWLGTADVTLNAGGWVLPAVLRISDALVTEGDTGTVSITFTVTMTHGGADDVTVSYATADGSAVAGKDYQSTTGPLIFHAGDTTKTITVLVNGDLIDEYDEQFYVNLSGASANANIADGQGIGTIADNDPPPTLSINDKSITEGNKKSTKTLTFTVTLTGATEKWVSVNYATANGTATTADHDYAAQAGTLYFSPGQTTATFSVVIYGDTKVEPDETFFVNLSGASNASILDGQGIGTILNDDHGHGGGKP